MNGLHTQSIPTINTYTNRKSKIPDSWIAVRGSLKGKNIDGLAYQRKIRSEWEVRLKKLQRQHDAR